MTETNTNTTTTPVRPRADRESNSFSRIEVFAFTQLLERLALKQDPTQIMRSKGFVSLHAKFLDMRNRLEGRPAPRED